MAETRAGSVFTPAIAAWSSPGRLGALNLPSWAPFALIAGFLGLAAMKKIPMWAGVGGAFASYWFTMWPPTVSTITNGTGIVANGTTIQFSINSPGTLSAGVMSVGGNNYPVLQTQGNADGTVTYYLDNPS